MWKRIRNIAYSIILGRRYKGFLVLCIGALIIFVEHGYRYPHTFTFLQEVCNAWPLVVLICALLFRKEIAAKIRELRSINSKYLNAEFREGIEAVDQLSRSIDDEVVAKKERTSTDERDSTQTKSTIDGKELDSFMKKLTRMFDDARSMADRNPKGAIERAAAAFDEAATLASKHWSPTPVNYMDITDIPKLLHDLKKKALESEYIIYPENARAYINSCERNAISFVNKLRDVLLPHTESTIIPTDLTTTRTNIIGRLKERVGLKYLNNKYDLHLAAPKELDEGYSPDGYFDDGSTVHIAEVKGNVISVPLVDRVIDNFKRLAQKHEAQGRNVHFYLIFVRDDFVAFNVVVNTADYDFNYPLEVDVISTAEV